MRKNRTFFDSVRCAINGLMIAYKEEKNFKVYTTIFIVFGLINLLLNIEIVYWIIYLICSLLAFSVECFNTAIERICDFLTTKENNSIKVIKDIAAGGVLYTGIIYFIVEGLIIYINL